MSKKLMIMWAAVLLMAFSRAVYAVDNGTEFGIEDDLTVLGAAGTAADPDVEIKGFTVFGSTQVTYTGLGAGGLGDVVVNGRLAVSSGAYFVGNSTFTSASSIFINDGIDGQVLAKDGTTGALQWTNVSALGDNLGNHTATEDLNLNSWGLINISTLTFLSNVFISSASAAEYGGIYISTHVYINGDIHAGYLYGDGSNLTGIAGDNLGNHIATQDLDMANFDIKNVNHIQASSVTFSVGLEVSKVNAGAADYLVKVSSGTNERFSILGDGTATITGGDVSGDYITKFYSGADLTAWIRKK